MNKDKDKERCPGCSRRCAAFCPRCKYGRNYFARMQEKETAGRESIYKWERYAARDSLTGQLLLTGKSVKQALKKGTVTQETVFEALTAEERKTLSALLGRIGAAAEECCHRCESEKSPDSCRGSRSLPE